METHLSWKDAFRDLLPTWGWPRSLLNALQPNATGPEEAVLWLIRSRERLRVWIESMGASWESSETNAVATNLGATGSASASVFGPMPFKTATAQGNEQGPRSPNKTTTASGRREPPVSSKNEALAEPVAPFLSRGKYDRIIVLQLPFFSSISLFSWEAQASMAEIASHLKPNGELLFVTRQCPSAHGMLQGHLQSCWQGALKHLPGVSSVKFYSDSWLRWSSWNWLINGRPRAGRIVARLIAPAYPLTFDQWKNAALISSTKFSQTRDRRPGAGKPGLLEEPCCLWARRQARVPERRAA